MYALSVVFGSASIAFLYNTEEAAYKSYDVLISPTESCVSIGDDFGQRGTFNVASLHGFVVENFDLSKHARAQQMLHVNAAQNLASRMATGDPGLRTSHSPPLVMPMGTNGPYPR